MLIGVVRLKTHTNSSHCLEKRPVERVPVRCSGQSFEMPATSLIGVWTTHAKNDAHDRTSATFQDMKDLGDVSLVVHYHVFYFDPGMRLERYELRPNHHLCLPAVPPEQQRGGARSLQAEDTLEVQDTGVVHRGRKVFAVRKPLAGGSLDSRFMDDLVEPLKVPGTHRHFKSQEKDPALKNVKPHGILFLARQCPTLDREKRFCG